MKELELLKPTGVKEKKVKLEPGIFDIKFSPSLVQQAIVTLQANRRKPLAHTKVFGECRGGGAKPWRQKGTGRARHGSRRSPLWRGGAVTFGPRKDRRFSRKINRKACRLALRMALSERLRSGELILLSDLPVAQGRTRELVSVLKKVKAQSGALIVLAKKNEKIKRAAANLVQAEVVTADGLNAETALLGPKLILTKDALARLQEKLASNNK